MIFLAFCEPCFDAKIVVNSWVLKSFKQNCWEMISIKVLLKCDFAFFRCETLDPQTCDAAPFVWRCLQPPHNWIIHPPQRKVSEIIVFVCLVEKLVVPIPWLVLCANPGPEDPRIPHGWWFSGCCVARHGLILFLSTQIYSLLGRWGSTALPSFCTFGRTYRSKMWQDVIAGAVTHPVLPEPFLFVFWSFISVLFRNSITHLCLLEERGAWPGSVKTAEATCDVIAGKWASWIASELCQRHQSSHVTTNCFAICWSIWNGFCLYFSLSARISV